MLFRQTEDIINDFYYITRVRIKRKTEEDPAYFGRGVADLLHGIEKYHSLNQAAKEMGMAYSKAWRIVGEAEQALGIPLIYRMRKNGSSLTKEGEKMLAAYEEAERAAWKAVEEVMERYYGTE